MRLTATAAIDLGALPSGPCPGCGGGLWWRVSVLSSGPNPWRCRRCEWPNRAAWLDGHAVGAAGSRPECDLYRLRIAATAPYACNERQPLQRNGTPRRGRRDRGARPRASMQRADEPNRDLRLVPIASLPEFRPTTRQPRHRLKAPPPVLARRPVFCVKRASPHSRTNILSKKRMCAVTVGTANHSWKAGSISKERRQRRWPARHNQAVTAPTLPRRFRHSARDELLRNERKRLRQ